jgi:hypothetical protein
MVFTLSITAAEGSSASISGITSSLKGMEIAQPRMESARMPPMAAGRSLVEKDL